MACASRLPCWNARSANKPYNWIFQKSLQASQGVTPADRGRWRDGIYQEIRDMMRQEGFSITEACRGAGLSRAGFYRYWEEHEPAQADTELRDAIHKIALENRFYGYRRVTAALRQQHWSVNHKRVSRLMRADNLLALRKKRYVLTTDSHHPFAIYPNLAPRLVVNSINQLWVADITYIRLRETFIYLAVILDAYSRKAVGWELGETLEASLAVAALKRALADRAIEAGIVHHSDRGVQYASADYVALLEDNGFLISMSRTGNPYDKAYASYCTSCIPCAASARSDSLTP
jgi:AcrR family transcriptional regulator